MQRIAIIGSPGSGKSTLAPKLGEILGIEVIHLDRLYHRPGWAETPKDEWRRMVEDLVRKDSWIIDGNYGGTMDIRLAAADTIVLLDLPRITCLLSTIQRAIRYRRGGRPDMAEGCRERFDREYLEFLKYIWRFPVDRTPRVYERIDEHGKGKQVFILHSRSEIDHFLMDISQGGPK